MAGYSRFDPLLDPSRLGGLRFQLPGKGWQPFIHEGKINPDAPITSPFGMRNHPVHGDYSMHNGVDIAFPKGTRLGWKGTGKLKAIPDGTQGYGGYGGLTKFEPGGAGYAFKFAHLESLPKPGEVENGVTLLGNVGSTGVSTGPHLHLEGLNTTLDGSTPTGTPSQTQSGVGIAQNPTSQGQQFIFNVNIGEAMKELLAQAKAKKEESQEPPSFFEQFKQSVIAQALGSNPYA
jgi:murein DD-endopeptidase MepM/ murein hydrolase activator NlpD